MFSFIESRKTSDGFIWPTTSIIDDGVIGNIHNTQYINISCDVWLGDIVPFVVRVALSFQDSSAERQVHWWYA